jgi:two-component system, chemotaxis family, protein-glutamate methylesterase/glutaminase
LFTRLLSERLNKTSGLTIQEGVKGQKLEVCHAWIAPGDFHMVLERRDGSVRLALNQDPPENSCRPAVDVLFRSVAKTFGANVLAVVLTGMGSDGVRGCELIREQGGQVLVQDERARWSGECLGKWRRPGMRMAFFLWTRWRRKSSVA